jgi:hypothetical protein
MQTYQPLLPNAKPTELMVQPASAEPAPNRLGRTGRGNIVTQCPTVETDAGELCAGFEVGMGVLPHSLSGPWPFVRPGRCGSDHPVNVRWPYSRR